MPPETEPEKGRIGFPLPADHPRAHQLVRDACRELLEEHGPALAPHETAEECANWLIQSVAEYRDLWGTPAFDIWCKRRGELQALNAWLLELSAVLSVNFAMMLDFREKHGAHILWPNEKVDPPDQPIFILRAMFAQLSNYNRGMILVAEKGLDLQLIALFRAHVELGHQTLLVTFDRSYYRDYLKWLRLAEGTLQEKMVHWTQKVKPSQVRKRLAVAIAKTKLDRDTAETLREHRRSEYEWLSDHNHGHPLNVIVRTYGDGGIRVGASPDGYTVDILRMVRFFNFELFSFLESALGTVQRWSMDPAHRFCVEVMFRWRALRRISLNLMGVDEADGLREESDKEAGEDEGSLSGEGI